MRRRSAAVIGLVSLSLGAATIELERVAVMDAQLWPTPMTAFTLLAPRGWVARGGVIWDPASPDGCGAAVPHIDWQADAPDGIGQLAVLPEEVWSVWSTRSVPEPLPARCFDGIPLSGRDFVLNYLARHRPAATLLDYRDITSEFAAQADAYRAALAAYADTGITVTFDAHAGLATLAYAVNGQPVHEIAGVAVFFMHYTLPADVGGSSPMSQVFTFPGFALRTTPDALDADLADTIRHSAEPDAEYLARRERLRRQQFDDVRRRIPEEHGRYLEELRDLQDEGAVPPSPNAD